MSPSNKKFVHALKNAPKLVSATVALMEELSQVLIREIDLVTKRKLAEHVELMKIKQKLALSYRANMKALTEQREMLTKLSDEAKQAVREASQMLAVAAKDNARALAASISATQQLLQNIMAAIKTEFLSKQTYSNPAKAHMQLGVYSPTCPSVAISRYV